MSIDEWSPEQISKDLWANPERLHQNQPKEKGLIDHATEAANAAAGVFKDFVRGITNDFTETIDDVRARQNELTPEQEQAIDEIFKEQERRTDC